MMPTLGGVLWAIMMWLVVTVAAVLTFVLLRRR
jgi:hypothetical protein